jgi:hypothetical protein
MTHVLLDLWPRTATHNTRNEGIRLERRRLDRDRRTPAPGLPAARRRRDVTRGRTQQRSIDQPASLRMCHRLEPVVRAQLSIDVVKVVAQGLR